MVFLLVRKVTLWLYVLSTCGIEGSVADPHHTDADVDLDTDFYSMRIRIGLFTLMRRVYFAPSVKWSKLQEEKKLVTCSVVDQHRFDADLYRVSDFPSSGCRRRSRSISGSCMGSKHADPSPSFTNVEKSDEKLNFWSQLYHFTFSLVSNVLYAFSILDSILKFSGKKSTFSTF
jgi:hypothetical protein